MKIYYSLEVQMAGENRMSDAVVESASLAFRFGKYDIDEKEEFSLNVLFPCEIKPSDMKTRVRSFLADNPTVHYVDVMYRYEYAMVPDRFVIWQDGRTQEYTGFIDFREDK